MNTQFRKTRSERRRRSHRHRNRLRLELLETRRLLATLVVNSTTDAVDLDPGDGICEISIGGACTLRAAIQEANSLPNIEGPDQIDLPSGTYTLSLGGIDDQQSLTGDLDITSDLVLQGAGAVDTIIDAGGIDRVLDVVRGSVVIDGVTIRGGLIEDDDVSIESSGGGIRNEGTLTLSQSWVTGNIAAVGAGVANYNGTLRISASIISGNGDVSTARGGGVSNYANYDPASLEIEDTTITNNRANIGGGVNNRTYDGVANGIISRSTISGNTAQSGGGISNRSVFFYGDAVAANLTIRGSTISGNVADQSGGGIHSQSDVGGAARLNIANSTIAANGATSGDGGGILNVTYGGATTRMESVIISGNAAGGAGPDLFSDTTTSTFSLIETTDGHSVTDGVGNNIVGENPQLGALDDNGGSTLTHLLLAGSPAIDQGSNSNLLDSDQRGGAFLRTVDDPGISNASDGTDIGAVEVGQVAAVDDFGDAPDGVQVGGILRQYPTQLASDGARHRVTSGGPTLGSLAPDVEQDGQPSATAIGDDQTGLDDENSLGPEPIALTPGSPLTGLSISHTGGSAGALLSAWIDLNLDGDWDDSGEQVLTDVVVSADTSITPLDSIIIPSSTPSGTTFIRVRISTESGLTPRGQASDGEVEDFAATVGTPPPQIADLSLTQTVDDATPVAGQIVAFTITVSNDGPDPATNVEVTDVLPGELTFARSTLSQGTFDDFDGTWSVGVLDPGVSAVLNITARVDSIGMITNTAEVTASDQMDPDSTPANGVSGEDDQASVAIVSRAPVADLSLTHIVDDPNPVLGQDVTFTITISNDGPQRATNVEVTDFLSDDLIFVSSTVSQGDYDDFDGLWLVGSLDVGASAVLNFTATVDSSDPITNTAEVTASDQADPDSTPGNDVSGEDDQVSIVLGTCLTAEPIHAGLNQLTFSCATPGSFSAFVRGTQRGLHTFQQYGETVDIGDAEEIAIAIADSRGVAIAYFNVTEEQLSQTILVQAFEMIPGAKKSNTLSLESTAQMLRAGGVGQGGPAIEQDHLQPVIDAVIRRWESIGVSADGLAIMRSAKVTLGDLPGDSIGRIIGETIMLDRDAAGNGWFVDATPGDDNEFSLNALTGDHAASADSAASLRVDLVTALVHEFGHLLGLPDLSDPGNVMHSTLDVGVRRLPTTNTNVRNSLDVNGDAIVSALDALVVINRLNRESQRMVDRASVWIGAEDATSLFLDANADFSLSALDALLIINHISGLRAESPSGESTEPTVPQSIQFASHGETDPDIEEASTILVPRRSVVKHLSAPSSSGRSLLNAWVDESVSERDAERESVLDQIAADVSRFG